MLRLLLVVGRIFILTREEVGQRHVAVVLPSRSIDCSRIQDRAQRLRQSGASVTIETAIMQRVLETHVREQLDALADLRVSLA